MTTDRILWLFILNVTDNIETFISSMIHVNNLRRTLGSYNASQTDEKLFFGKQIVHRISVEYSS